MSTFFQVSIIPVYFDLQPTSVSKLPHEPPTRAMIAIANVNRHDKNNRVEN